MTLADRSHQTRPRHGGRLRSAALQYGIPLQQWLDLSTGISPVGYPVPPVSAAAWARLPEDDDELCDAASAFYGTPHVLPIAGSQAAIQTLPHILHGTRVAIVGPTYAEHLHAWHVAGAVEIGVEQLDAAASVFDIVVVVNPDNPSGRLLPAERLLQIRHKLAQRGGWLVLDEAFIDPNPEFSLAAHVGAPGLLVLRSMGKFFGLAGARVGFMLAPALQREALQQLLGPWTLSGPAREVATLALRDTAWQADQRLRLGHYSDRLSRLLRDAGFTNESGCALFRQVLTPAAAQWHDGLARLGILTRLFDTPARLRFGLPGSDQDLQRLAVALEKLNGASHLSLNRLPQP